MVCILEPHLGYLLACSGRRKRQHYSDSLEKLVCPAESI